MKIVGVGCGPNLLTCQAKMVIKSATLIFGSERAIALVQDSIPPECEVKTIEDYRALKSLPDETVLLSTGDPMLSGLGYLPGEVIPGISSVQLGAARLHIPLTNLLVLTAHGRGYDETMHTVCDEVKRDRSLCLITDPEFNIGNLADRLNPYPDYRLVICQDIGYPEEKIIKGTVDSPPHATSGMYILFLLPSV
ncbi:cobalt-precorrin-7 (C(5))-methyltransferase [Methanospirillum lacunae]|uniref:Cobalt-precorrin-7 (C(5))-methyltransferase n=1 Tax=Methanospirillum lacunae TaxID=668570 RepID=A0A2V2MW35_9EURY|nr:cobalt-precorrin-7 (C(5))-methyltransferase [Methanospirillum lacunae]PWR70510.1 cobalt-precorrin-7 (C(5))-methyltransferase [Methanospirillum lacunae]